MSNIESIVITNTSHVTTLPFWPNGLPQLSITLESVAEGLLASGFDPDTNTGVFEAILRSDQRDAFIAAVTDGQEGTEIDLPSNENIDPHTVVVGPPGGDPGPKFTVTLSATILSVARTGT